MSSQTYWSKREAEALKNRITDEREYDKRIKSIYSDMLAACQSEINAFYGKYAAAEGISLAEAKKRVSKLDIAAYERKAKRYVKEKNFSKKANEEMRLYNAAMKINRLEMLKANIGLELISGYDELDEFMSEILKGRTEDELARQAGILGKTVRNNAKAADAIVNASFHNATFSERIWMYQDLMKADLSKLLESGLIQGKNPRVLARELKKTFQTSTFNAERLMRTELARVQTEAQKQSFERGGFDEYIFIVNGGCCPICQGLSDKHFKVSKMMPGENAPPMHPHCRCSTAAYSDRAEYEEWLDFLEKGGTTEEYNKQKADKVNNALTNKGAKNGKMKPREFKKFYDGSEVNDFFYYDDEKRGLMARKNSQYGKWLSSLSDEEKDFISWYTSDGYGDINDFLRKINHWETINADLVEDAISKLDNSISKFNLKNNITVQRGAMNNALDELRNKYEVNVLSDLVGKKYNDKGYMSSTALMGNTVATTKPVVFEIDIPAGKGRGAYVNKMAGINEDVEYEFLLKRNANFTIVDITEDADIGKVYVKMVMDDD